MSGAPATLTEDDVVDAVSDYLERAGWTVEQRLRTAERGVDIVACRSDQGVLRVEAKGATSSKSRNGAIRAAVQARAGQNSRRTRVLHSRRATREPRLPEG
jgi:hypothetical protein